MENKISYYKNSWRIYLGNFGKLFGFTLSILILFLTSYILYTLFSNYDLGLSAILLFAFGLVPLFFSLQLVIAKVSAGQEISYNEIYQHYKIYYGKNNKGTYSVILNIFLSMLITYVCVFLSLFLYDIFNYGLLNQILDKYLNLDVMTVNLYNEMLLEVLNMEGYIYYLIPCLSLPFLFFFQRIKKRLMIPYFSMIFPLPSIMSGAINKKVYELVGKDIKKQSFLGNLVFSLCFFVGFVLTGILIAIFNFDIDLGLLIIFSLAGGLLLSSFVLPPVLINYCFIADKHHSIYLKEVNNYMIKLAGSVPLEGFDEKAALKKLLDKMKKDIEENNDKIDNDKKD